jgi:hypothetical protein
MKKSIVTLLILLFVLIVTCVYQNTYRLYELTTANNDAPVSHTETVKTISPKKESIVVQQTESVQVKKLTKPVPEKSHSEESSFLDSVTQTIKSAITPDKKSEIVTQDVIKNEIMPLTVLPTPSIEKTQKEEKEVVDYLLSVLKEQDRALITRDEAENRLHSLIKRALENRQIAIANMEKASLTIDQEQQKRLKNRKDISQKNTKEEGK